MSNLYSWIYNRSSTNILGVTFMVFTLIVFSIIAIFAGSFGEKLLQNEKSSTIINLAQGTIFIGLGLLKLLWFDKSVTY